MHPHSLDLHAATIVFKHCVLWLQAELPRRKSILRVDTRMGCCRCAVRSTTPPQLVLLLVVLYASAVADAISVRASQASRQAVLGGGSGATQCDDHDDGAPDVPPTFSDFASTAVDFFDAFGEAVKQASSTCKPSSFGLSPPSAPSIQQRPDRAVFSKVYTHLRGLHADAISMISRGELTSFITAWLRLNQQLQLFLCGEDAVQARRLTAGCARLCSTKTRGPHCWNGAQRARGSQAVRMITDAPTRGE
eukprot:6207270-Pleurochrysis_carterae.AAC.2